MGQENIGKQQQGRGGNGSGVKTHPRRQADGRRGPQARCRGQPRDAVPAPDEDHAAAQKAYARNDLGAQAHGVGALPQDIRGVKPHQGRHGCADAHDDVGAHPRRPALGSPLGADKAPQHRRQQQPHHGGQEIIFL